ncbi:MAG: hypothetical protein R2847_04150 [Bacteroidia bacterium]
MKGQKSIHFTHIICGFGGCNNQAQWSTTTISSARSATLATTGADNSAIFGGGIGIISIPPLPAGYV